MLTAAAMNSAIGREPDDAMQQTFLRFISELSTSHIQVLKYLKDGSHRSARITTSTLMQVIKSDFPELREQKSFVICITPRC